MHNFKIKTLFKIIFVISFLALIIAVFIEYILGHQPCNLCLLERIPYGLAIILIIFSLIFKRDEKFITLLLILVFSFSFMISFYHFGIEQGFFKESSVCGIKNMSNIISKEELLKQLQEKTISCKDVTFRIFGFSLTTINIIINLILVVILSKLFKNYENFKK